MSGAAGGLVSIVARLLDARGHVLGNLRPISPVTGKDLRGSAQGQPPTWRPCQRRNGVVSVAMQQGVETAFVHSA